jgi:hypothetical protein
MAMLITDPSGKPMARNSTSVNFNLISSILISTYIN